MSQLPWVPSPLPAPHRAVLGVNDLADPLEPALGENSRGRGVGVARVGADKADALIRERELHHRARRIAGIASSPTVWVHPVRDLDDSIGVRRALVSAAT